MKVEIGKKYICGDERVKYIEMVYKHLDCTSLYSIVGLVVTDIRTATLELFNETDGGCKDDPDYCITERYTG